MLRFYLPLIEPDGRISRIRLSDKDSSVRPREGPCTRPKPGKVQDLVQVVAGEASHAPVRLLVLRTQPPTQPTTHVLIECSIGRADRPQAEIVRPANQHPVELGNYRLYRQQCRVSPGALRERVADAANLLGRRFRAQIGPPRLPGVAPANGVTQKIKRFFRQPT